MAIVALDATEVDGAVLVALAEHAAVQRRQRAAKVVVLAQRLAQEVAGDWSSAASIAMGCVWLKLAIRASEGLGEVLSFMRRMRK